MRLLQQLTESMARIVVVCLKWVFFFLFQRRTDTMLSIIGMEAFVKWIKWNVRDDNTQIYGLDKLAICFRLRLNTNRVHRFNN